MPSHDTTEGIRPRHPRVPALRELAEAGRLGSLSQDCVAGLRAAAYDIAWPLVWRQHTRRIEIGRGHVACASSLSGMTAQCLDRFHDDVEAVVEYLLASGSCISNLEGWITSRISKATVDGYRKRRGLRGALQRIRVPGWLATALAHDRELVELAGSIIEWVGVPATAGTRLWPLETWTERRAIRNDGAAGVQVDQVAADVEQVLAAMRTRPNWYATYIERPIGHKPLPTAVAPVDDREACEVPWKLAERTDAELIGLAAAATDAISDALATGEDPSSAVPRVLRAVFLGGLRDGRAIGVAPGDGLVDETERLAAILANEAALGRLVDAVLDIVGGTDGRLGGLGRLS